MANEGTVVKLDSGQWAQLKRIPCFGPMGPTIVVAIELDSDSQRRLNARPTPPVSAGELAYAAS